MPGRADAEPIAPAQALRRRASLYFVLQAFAVLAWWVLLWRERDVLDWRRTPYRGPGSDAAVGRSPIIRP